MIVVTGAAGFIGSCFVEKLNSENFTDIILVDDFSNERKAQNYQYKKFTAKIDRSEFIKWIDDNHRFVQFMFHLGARTDTTEFNKNVFDRLNFNYSCSVWNACVKYGLPLVYASSAATYGDGENGYSDDHALIPSLKPLNPYGESKNDFDMWALEQSRKPYFWAGLKFFNVYGPNEYHKNRMASVIFHSFLQISEKNKIKLFRSHKTDCSDGEQRRDFIYVKDVTEVLYFLLHNRNHCGIYNLGTGIARTFNDLANSVFSALGKTPEIEYIDIPEDIRDKYQYFTEAKMEKLRSIGYSKPFNSLEEGISDYVLNYLETRKYL